MKVAFFNVAVKSAPFIAADFQFDADLWQLFLERLGDATA